MSVKIHIEGDGLSFEGESDITKAAQIIAFLNTEQYLSNARPLAMTSRVGSYTSPRQVLVESGAKTNDQKITALGKYSMDLSQRPGFTVKEVQELMKRAGESVPKNFSRDLKRAVRLGYIFEDHESKGQYIVSELGDTSIDSGFKNQPKLPNGSLRKSRKGGKNVKISDVVTELEITPEQRGCPNYWDISNKGHKVMWILRFAHLHDINELSGKEIEVLADKLKDNIRSGDVNALTTSLIKRGKLSANSGRYKILQPGIDFFLDGQSDENNKNDAD